MEKRVIEEFVTKIDDAGSALGDSYWIRELTEFAWQNKVYAAAIAKVITKREPNLDILNLVDSILAYSMRSEITEHNRNEVSIKEYRNQFSHAIVFMFADVFKTARKEIRLKLYTLRGRWKHDGIFSLDTILDIDHTIHSMDKNWPVTKASEGSLLTQSEHDPEQVQRCLLARQFGEAMSVTLPRNDPVLNIQQSALLEMPEIQECQSLQCNQSLGHCCMSSVDECGRLHTEEQKHKGPRTPPLSLTEVGLITNRRGPELKDVIPNDGDSRVESNMSLSNLSSVWNTTAKICSSPFHSTCSPLSEIFRSGSVKSSCDSLSEGDFYSSTTSYLSKSVQSIDQSSGGEAYYPVQENSLMHTSEVTKEPINPYSMNASGYSKTDSQGRSQRGKNITNSINSPVYSLLTDESFLVKRSNDRRTREENSTSRSSNSRSNQPAAAAVQLMDSWKTMTMPQYDSKCYYIPEHDPRWISRARSFTIEGSRTLCKSFRQLWVNSKPYDIRIDGQVTKIIINETEHSFRIVKSFPTDSLVFDDSYIWSYTDEMKIDFKTSDGMAWIIQFTPPRPKLKIGEWHCYLDRSGSYPAVQIGNTRHGIKFTGDPRHMYIDDVPVEVPFDKPIHWKKCQTDRVSHLIAFGGPGHEVIIDDEWHDIRFGGPARFVHIGETLHKIELLGAVPKFETLGEMVAADEIQQVTSDVFCQSTCASSATIESTPSTAIESTCALSTDVQTHQEQDQQATRLFDHQTSQFSTSDHNPITPFDDNKENRTDTMSDEIPHMLPTELPSYGAKSDENHPFQLDSVLSRRCRSDSLPANLRELFGNQDIDERNTEWQDKYALDLAKEHCSDYTGNPSLSPVAWQTYQQNVKDDVPLSQVYSGTLFRKLVETGFIPSIEQSRCRSQTFEETQVETSRDRISFERISFSCATNNARLHDVEYTGETYDRNDYCQQMDQGYRSDRNVQDWHQIAVQENDIIGAHKEYVASDCEINNNCFTALQCNTLECDGDGIDKTEICQSIDNQSLVVMQAKLFRKQDKRLHCDILELRSVSPQFLMSPTKTVEHHNRFLSAENDNLVTISTDCANIGSPLWKRMRSENNLKIKSVIHKTHLEVKQSEKHYVRDKRHLGTENWLNKTGCSQNSESHGKNLHDEQKPDQISRRKCHSGP